MKKALMAIAATVLAFGFAFGFAACGNSENSNGGNGGNSESSGENNVEDIVDDSVLTEEQWKKAIADTAASKTVTVDLDYHATYTESKHSGSGTETRVAVGKECYKTDLNKYLTYYMTEYKESVDGGEQKITNDEENYLEISGKKLIWYYCYGEHDFRVESDGEEPNEWRAEPNEWQAIIYDEYDSADAAKTAFEEQYKIPPISVYVLGEFTATVNGETVTKPLAELFGAFTYDSSANVYTGEITQHMGQMDEIITAKITFKNGKISKIERSYVESSGTEVSTVSMTFSYGEVNIVIPQEAKDAYTEEQQ